MQTEKKTFTKAEVEVVRFDKQADIITESVCEYFQTGEVGGESFGDE